jgi:UPF0271 protein
MNIDLNCDMGELDDAAHEAALMEYITSANIACGGHAGDARTMERTARLALSAACASAPTRAIPTGRISDGWKSP